MKNTANMAVCDNIIVSYKKSESFSRPLARENLYVFAVRSAVQIMCHIILLQHYITSTRPAENPWVTLKQKTLSFAYLYPSWRTCFLFGLCLWSVVVRGMCEDKPNNRRSAARIRIFWTVITKGDVILLRFEMEIWKSNSERKFTATKPEIMFTRRVYAISPEIQMGK